MFWACEKQVGYISCSKVWARLVEMTEWRREVKWKLLSQKLRSK